MKRLLIALLLLVLVGDSENIFRYQTAAQVGKCTGCVNADVVPDIGDVYKERNAIYGRFGTVIPNQMVLIAPTGHVLGWMSNTVSSGPVNGILVLQPPFISEAEWKNTLAHEIGHTVVTNFKVDLADYAKSYSVSPQLRWEMMAEDFARCFGDGLKRDWAGYTDPETKRLVTITLDYEPNCKWFQELELEPR